ncbi:MAG: thiamine pyrophosphate-binding protein [Haliea sp.]|uniref:thiamine pyrophosphate-binding protein n=1 Tax=Haliea sp. TaxID=1932666 RepID=UPI0032EEBF17
MEFENMILGRDIIIEILKTENVRYIFGNPGTTELSLIDRIIRECDLEYVLALQEASALGMADGYARATNRPAFVNLHASAGLGNAMGALTNAAYMHSPLVVTAGQQDYRHIVDDPWLSGDLVGMAKPFTKWAHEIRTVDEIGPVLRRAFKDANTHPKGPVFLSLPFHFMDEPSSSPIPAKSHVYDLPLAVGMDLLADSLLDCGPSEIAVIACDEISRADALTEVVTIVEKLGCDVFGAPVHDSVVFPTSHPLWVSMMSPSAEEIRELLEPYKKVFVIGDRGFMGLIYSGSPIPEHTEILHLSADSSTVAYTYETSGGFVGNIKASLERLDDYLGERVTAKVRLEERERARREEDQTNIERVQAQMTRKPMHPETAAYYIASSIQDDAIIVEEAPSMGVYLRKYIKTSKRLQYNFSKGGGLGWAMPAAVGIALSERQSKTICIVGDGAAMYSPQAIWTAAHKKLSMTFIVANNSEYGILKNFLRGHYPNQGEERFIGMDISDPAVNFIALAASMGVHAIKIDDPQCIPEAVREANDHSGVSLIEITVAPSVEHSNTPQAANYQE